MTLEEMQEKKKEAIRWLKSNEKGTLKICAGEIPLLTVNRYNGNENVHCKVPGGYCHCEGVDMSEMEQRLIILDEENPVITVEFTSSMFH